MVTQAIRKVGNSFVVTIPKDDMRRLDLNEGDIIQFEPTRMELKPVLNPEIRSLFERDVESLKPMLEYLKDR